VFNYEINEVASEISLLALSILLFNSWSSDLHSAVFLAYLESASFYVKIMFSLIFCNNLATSANGALLFNYKAIVSKSFFPKLSFSNDFN